jgi:hypothetical protein
LRGTRGLCNLARSNGSEGAIRPIPSVSSSGEHGMNNDARTHGLWEASAPPAIPTTTLYGECKADVVIIGAGYTGCSAALHLAEAGKQAIVLEATEIGFGGAGRNVGLVNAGLWVMPSDIPGLLGETYGERILEQLGQAPRMVYGIVDKYGIECQATPNSTLHVAVGAKGWTKSPAGRANGKCAGPMSNCSTRNRRARRWARRPIPAPCATGARGPFNRWPMCAALPARRASKARGFSPAAPRPATKTSGTRGK